MSNISYLIPKNLIGLVLCGGESKRMGSDKGLLLKNNIPWSAIVVNEVKKLNIPVYISINSTQLTNYKSAFSEDKLILDAVEAKGPLTGLLSAHKAFPDKDILIVACDMIDIKSVILRELLENYMNSPSFDFYTFINNNFCEPLCSIYCWKRLAEVNKKLDSGSLKTFSLLKILEAGNTKSNSIIESKYFNNYNHLNP